MIDFQKISESEYHFEYNGHRGLIFRLNQTPLVFYWSIFKDSKRVATNREVTLLEAQNKIRDYFGL